MRNKSIDGAEYWAPETEKVIQTIVVRRLYPGDEDKTKRLTNGKYCSQAAHASIAFLTNKFRNSSVAYTAYCDADGKGIKQKQHVVPESLTKEESIWVQEAFTKIVLCVDTEEELLEIYNSAQSEGLTAYMIEDAGLTEFNGIPTKTCVAIGPHYKSKIDKITKNLRLF